jgi:hypothetical protein
MKLNPSWDRWLFHHESVPFHRELSLKQLSSHKEMVQLVHPLYLCSLSKYEFSTCLWLRIPMKGSHFDSLEILWAIWWQYGRTFEKLFPVVFPDMPQVLIWVYKVRRQVLWEWEVWSYGNTYFKVCNFVVRNFWYSVNMTAVWCLLMVMSDGSCEVSVWNFVWR